MKSRVAVNRDRDSRPAPHGAGGLKLYGMTVTGCVLGPAPHGAGGLKSRLKAQKGIPVQVPPRTGRVD